MQPRVTDVEQLKKRVRKLAAGQVLEGGRADACLDLGHVEGGRVCIAAGYGPLRQGSQVAVHDRLIWILDGRAEVHDAADHVTYVSQGESTVLAAGEAYRLVFPQLSIYLWLEAVGSD